MGQKLIIWDPAAEEEGDAISSKNGDPKENTHVIKTAGRSGHSVDAVNELAPNFVVVGAGCLNSPSLTSPHLDTDEYSLGVSFHVFIWDPGNFLLTLDMKRSFRWLIEFAISINETSGKCGIDDIDEKPLRQFTSRTILDLLVAMFDSIVGQEVDKACFGKFHFLHQILYFDPVESLLVDSLKPDDLKPLNSHYGAQISVLESKLHKKVKHAKFSMVETGALGCTFLKNLSLMVWDQGKVQAASSGGSLSNDGHIIKALQRCVEVIELDMWQIQAAVSSVPECIRTLRLSHYRRAWHDSLAPTMKGFRFTGDNEGLRSQISGPSTKEKLVISIWDPGIKTFLSLTLGQGQFKGRAVDTFPEVSELRDFALYN